MTEGGSEFGLSQEIINNFGDESITGYSVLNQEDQEIPLKLKDKEETEKIILILWYYITYVTRCLQDITRF